MRRLNAGIVGCALAAFVTTEVSAQESLLPSASWGIAPVFSMWHFGTPLAQANGAVRDVRQIGVPLRASVVLGGRWTFDASGAFATSSVTLDDGTSTRTLTLSGLTDVRVRATSALLGNRLLVTAGVNIPTGKTGLNAEETTVLQTIGAPALRMPVNSLGLGAGGTFGLAVAAETGPWALAIGGSAEARTEYTALELALASGDATTKIKPGVVVHGTIGADRAVGEHRLALLFVADKYTEDQITLAGDAESASTHYTLGMQETALARLDLDLGGWREANAGVSFRHRGAFTDESGESVEGSSGSYIEGSFSGVRGGPVGRGLIMGVDAHYHTGFTFSDALVAAATSAAGVTVGVELPFTSVALRLALRAQYAHIDTGASESNAVGFSLVGVLGARRQAQ